MVATDSVRYSTHALALLATSKTDAGAPPEKGEIPNGFLIRISQAENEAPHPIYDNQISVRALPGLPPEAAIEISYQEIVSNYPDGNEYRIQKPLYAVKNGDTANRAPRS